MKKIFLKIVIGVVLVCILFVCFLHYNNSDYLQKARKYGHFTGYKN